MALDIGFHEGVSSEVYHADPAISRSQISMVMKGDSLRKVRHKIDDDGDDDTAALAFGRLAHAYILEGLQVAAFPDDAKLNTKEGKAAKAAVVAENPGATIVRESELRQLEGMRRELQAHKIVGRWIDGIKCVEPSIVWKVGGVVCRARPDAITDLGAFDLKFVRSIRDRDIERAILDYGWNVQVVHYEDGGASCGRFRDYTLVFVDKEPPHEVRVFDIGPEIRQYTSIRWSEALYRIAAAQAMDVWPGHPHDITEMQAPLWMLRELEMHLGEVA